MAVLLPQTGRRSSRPSPLPTEVLTTSLLPDIGTELREGYAEIGDTNLHYVEAGDGSPLDAAAVTERRDAFLRAALDQLPARIS